MEAALFYCHESTVVFHASHSHGSHRTPMEEEFASPTEEVDRRVYIHHGSQTNDVVANVGRRFRAGLKNFGGKHLAHLA